ncbi:hypothetical protein CONPUDRAFT_65969, partial [Coniophora puteana RWD-64-598 SS2]
QIDYLRIWRQYEEGQLHALLEMERRRNETCPHCHASPAGWRCLSCFGTPEGCTDCMRNTHKQLPFHNVESWEGSHWRRVTTDSLGVHLHMGHDGAMCQSLATSADDESWVEQDLGDISDADRVALECGLGQSFSHLPPPDSDTDEGKQKAPKESRITVVDVTSIYEFTVVWCECQPDYPFHRQLLDMRLYPASYNVPQTVFTFDVLEDFTLSNLENKVPANAYFSRLVHATNSAFPALVPVRSLFLISRFQRCARQWMHLMSRKSHGHGYGQPDQENAAGSMAEFCAACPQPGVNLAENWETMNAPEWLHARQLMVDGNFKQQNYRMRRPENDICLGDGLAYTVNEDDYQKYLSVSKEKKQRSTCNDHRAVLLTNKRRSHVQVTGIAAVACARHACFVPNATADLQFGERQINIDYVIVNAIWMMLVLRLVLFYDIACQYMVNFLTRVRDHPLLSLPAGLKIIPSIGLFHVHGHRESCVARYSPTFIKGLGWVSGEGIETVWPGLNDLAHSTRYMAPGGRRQFLNLHMGWHNDKKKHGIDLRKLENVCEDALIAGWQQLLNKAYAAPGNAKVKDEVFNVKVGKLPSRAEKGHEITQKHGAKREDRDMVRWANLGMDIEEAQIRVQMLVRRYQQHRRRADLLTIQKEQRKLSLKIQEFEDDAIKYMGGLDVDDPHSAKDAHPTPLGDVQADDDDVMHADLDDTAEPENVTIGLPSAFGYKRCMALGLSRVVDVEMQLRKGQAHDALQHIRDHIGKKSVLARKALREVRGSQRQEGAVWDRFHVLSTKINLQRLYYNRARAAMYSLAKDPAEISQYQKMTRVDLQAQTEQLIPDARGMRHRSLSWIWTIDIDEALAGKDRSQLINAIAQSQWLMAKCIVDRAQEEIILLRHEMEWVPASFKHAAAKWELLAETPHGKQVGHRSYAMKQRAANSRLHVMAVAAFKALLNKRPPPDGFNVGVSETGDVTW